MFCHPIEQDCLGLDGHHDAIDSIGSQLSMMIWQGGAAMDAARRSSSHSVLGCSRGLV